MLGLLALPARLIAGLASTISLLSAFLGALAAALATGAHVSAQFLLASIDLPYLDWPLVLLAYDLLFGLTLVSPRRLLATVVAHPAWAVTALAALVVLLYTLAQVAPDPRTHLQFLETPGGNAHFIRTAGGTRILVDGSSEPSALLAPLGGQMPFWDRRLDLVVASIVCMAPPAGSGGERAVRGRLECSLVHRAQAILLMTALGLWPNLSCVWLLPLGPA